MSIVSSWLLQLWQRAVDANERTIIEEAASALGSDGTRSFCDLGCGDGILTERIALAARLQRTTVVEAWEHHAALAEARGFNVIRDDLNGRLSLASNSFDVVVSNQVIEHLYDTESFLDEALRILKPGGILIVSTENAASWHNIFALILGWQPFSSSNISSRKAGIGNPLSLAPSQSGWPFPMQHHRIFTAVALRELLELHRCTNVRVFGAGYYPLPGRLGALDPRHAAFITVVATKAASACRQ